MTDALDATVAKGDISTMHFIKLFLAGSFAVAATLRAILTLVVEAVGASSGVLLGYMTGPTGMLLETLASFMIGAVLASRIASTRKQKVSRD